MILRPVAVHSGKAGLNREIISNCLRQASTRCQSTAAVQGQTLSTCQRPDADSHQSDAKPYSDIPGPKPIPLLGNTWRFFPVIGDLGRVKAKDLPRYIADTWGPIAKLGGLPARPDIVILTDADAVAQVLRNEGQWPIREGADSLLYYMTKIRTNVLVSLIASQGKEWQDFRTSVNQVMMQPRRVKVYTNPINIVAQEFIDRMWKIRDKTGQMPEDFQNELAKFALESITYVTLDARLGTFADNLPEDSEPQKMIKSVQDVFEAMFLLDLRPSVWKYVSTPAYRRLVKGLDYFQGVAQRHVSNAMERLKSLPPAELGEREFSVLENLLLETKDPGKAIAMALDMMLAGVDTTSMQIAVAIYQLASNPEKQRLLQEELDRVLPHPEQPITSKELEEMKYLRACIKESTRIVPIILGTSRSAVKDMVIMGYQVPNGTRIVFNNSQMCVDEKYFPRADEFLPERWLPGGESLKARHPFAHLPFGFGPRMCVGKRFADLEMEIFLAKLFRSFNMEWHHPPPETDIRLLITYTSPLKFTMHKRS